MKGATACAEPQCGAPAVSRGRCAAHSREVDADRGSRHERGYNYAWTKARSFYLRNHPLCVRCEALGYTSPATVVDHITPHRGDDTLFWQEANWQALCKRCHDIKTGGGR